MNGRRTGLSRAKQTYTTQQLICVKLTAFIHVFSLNDSVTTSVCIANTLIGHYIPRALLHKALHMGTHNWSLIMKCERLSAKSLGANEEIRGQATFDHQPYANSISCIIEKPSCAKAVDISRTRTYFLLETRSCMYGKKKLSCSHKRVY
jgi:hypothetical protein